MKIFRSVLLTSPFFLLVPAFGDEPVTTSETISPAVSSAAVIGAVADGTPPPSLPAPVLPRFSVKSAVITDLGDYQLVTKRVAPIELPAATESAATPEPSSFQAQTDESGTKDEAELFILSATVYDHGKTLVRWSSTGNGGPEMAAWSNIDFNHLTGFSEYQLTRIDGSKKSYNLVMGIGNEDTAALAETAQENGSEYHAPQIPALPPLSQGPVFLIVQGDATNTAALEMMQGLHELYRSEGQRLKQAWMTRDAAEKAEAEERRLNPPPTPDVEIYYWRKGR